MTDREMHDVVVKGVRDGICCISYKHAVAKKTLHGRFLRPDQDDFVHLLCGHVSIFVIKICNIRSMHFCHMERCVLVALNRICRSFIVLRNNLYSTAMCESLPEKDFDFLLDEQVATFDFMSMPDDGSDGYILEVDLEYPEELHGEHNDYPLCPESAVIVLTDLSPYTVSLADKMHVKPSVCRKLLSTLKIWSDTPCITATSSYT